MVRGAILLVLLTCQIIALQAQTYPSGSTGALGAFAPTQNTEIQLPDNGELDYTTINIPAGVTITFKRNAKNTPVIMLAQGNVMIAGQINVSGKSGSLNFTGTVGSTGGQGGPGGFNGGSGGSYGDPNFNGLPGDGPGGGGGGRGIFNCSNGDNIFAGGAGSYAEVGIAGTTNITAASGSSYGNRTLVPLIGGSGGGGGGSCTLSVGGSGGGGGGAILLASSGTITFTNTTGVEAVGGRGAIANEAGASGRGGGGGAGGAIRIVATTIVGIGSITFNVSGGFAGAYAGGGARGYIRIQAFNTTDFRPTAQPSNAISAGLPQIPAPPIPQLVIASIAGQNAPATPLGSFAAAPDITVPAAQTNPVSVVVQGVNIPVGTTVKVTVTPETGGTRTTAPDVTLTGTVAASTATAQATLPQGMSVISATATIDLTIAKAEPRFINGERVTRMEIAASYGGASEITYITESGKRIRQTE